MQFHLTFIFTFYTHYLHMSTIDKSCFKRRIFKPTGIALRTLRSRRRGFCLLKNKRVSKRVSERVSKRVSKRVSETVSKKVSERVLKSLNATLLRRRSFVRLKGKQAI